MCSCVTVCACGGSGRPEPEEKSCGDEILTTAVALGLAGAFFGPAAALAGGIAGVWLGAAACRAEENDQKRIWR